ncbi:UNVERIFIED_CONTAM: hypothetical protein FKN15_027888 [Acipenser sinensis]
MKGTIFLSGRLPGEIPEVQGDPLPGNVLLGADAATLHLYYEKLRSIQRPYAVFPVIYSPPL